MNDELNQYLIEGSTFLMSLNKITGKKVKDISGYISSEYDDPTFKLSEVIFEDGTKFGCEGEHDFPYLTEYDENTYNTLEKIEKLENDED